MARPPPIMLCRASWWARREERLLPTLIVSHTHAYFPWQCLYFLPEPHGQSSLRPTLPQLAGFLGSRPAVAAGTSEALANASSSSPVLGSNLCASIAGKAGC